MRQIEKQQPFDAKMQPMLSLHLFQISSFVKEWWKEQRRTLFGLFMYSGCEPQEGSRVKIY